MPYSIVRLLAPTPYAAESPLRLPMRLVQFTAASPQSTFPPRSAACSVTSAGASLSIVSPFSTASIRAACVERRGRRLRGFLGGSSAAGESRHRTGSAWGEGSMAA